MYVKVDSEGAASRYTIGALRRDNPDVSFADHPAPDALAEFGVYPVAAVEPPSVGTHQTLSQGEPELVEGEWRQTWIVSDVPLADRKEAMLAALADIRWQHETGGIVVNGAPIKTDGESQRKLTSAYVQAQSNPNFTVANWKLAPGQFVTLNAATIIAIGDAVTAHVQACFDHEAAITENIAPAPDHAALDLIDMWAGWP